MSTEAESQDTPNSTPINDGMECDAKEIYEAQKDSQGNITWSAKYPDDVEDAAENHETARYAILVRYTKSFDSRKKMDMESIIIQSPLLKQVLAKVMKGYPGVAPGLQRLAFPSPFKPFVHRWIQLLQAIDNEKDEDTKAHIVLLRKVLEPELKDISEAIIDYIENKVVTYDHLWTIFQPDCILYKQVWGRDSALKFVSGDKGSHLYRVYCRMVNWDGERFGLESIHYDIPRFIGTAEIGTLPIFPIEFHPDRKKIKAELFKRGKLFEQYRGYHFRYYKSFAMGEDPECGCPIKITVDSRIIVDTRAYGKFNPNKVSPLNALEHKRASEIFDDVISGKGKGIIFLLSGGPGIGKTLTAESVAEQMRVPLYMLSAGDLGTESKDVESTLRSVLQMVTCWNAVLLLDECDVFLEARTSNSLERNKIVSIFLRTLEYYEGILFMTTNRVNNIDPAFKSRIHLSMDYKDLDKNAREKIWKNFLALGEGHEQHHQITDVDVGKLADSNINGRQIKNVLKTAKLLAGHKGEFLKFEHIRTVVSVEEN
ncbi:hypothetical protein BOTCAL_0156g00220 [Botryotinia calthae]|uniref:AAA+ ATPase domain-containing protein n=1 Tax=Botryotinia calthae TaxID=38488 RepID=A0A4Y8D2M1_9HELO|nr:hypothetical protein BOTCAL_0156g00220 [Botryotinia calthae]